jgi:NAD(P)-dependent dehydrogenase (short-subunit alcohol dehydrogenase family)
MSELHGKVALVTGAGSGIGEATAHALAAAGAQVGVADVNAEAAAAVAESIRAAGNEALAITVDVAVEAQVAAAVEKLVGAYGGLDVVHNNAAITGTAHMAQDGPLHEMEQEIWDLTMAVNLRGAMLFTKHSVQPMIKRGGGLIVNTTSSAGILAEPVRVAYGTSKAAIIGFTRNVATQYGRLGIRCVAIAPGLIVTPALEASFSDEIVKKHLRHQPLPRLGRPADIADVVVFLATRGTFISGVTIPVDGAGNSHKASYADQLEEDQSPV